MARIFISYRRQDSQHPVDRLHAEMKKHVEPSDVFIDIDGIPLGLDFVEHIENRVAQCQVLLAVIGPGWLDSRKAPGGPRRLDDPGDFVRVEIASALKRGVPVVPVFLDGAAMPDAADLPDDLQALRRRNAEQIRRESFDADVARLLKRLPIDLSQTAPRPVAPTTAALAASAVPAGTELGTLKVLRGPDGPIRGLTFFVKEGERTKIGRSPENHIALTDPVLSKHHCGVSASQGRLYLEDFQTSNGSFLNGRKLDRGEAAELKTGDEIELGGYVIGVQIFARPAA